MAEPGPGRYPVLGEDCGVELDFGRTYGTDAVLDWLDVRPHLRPDGAAPVLGTVPAPTDVVVGGWVPQPSASAWSSR